MVTLYNVISSDGFIARKDGSEDFIPDELWPKTLEVFRRYDTLVMGSGTYEALQKYDQNLLAAFEQLPIKKIIVTRKENFEPKPGYIVVRSAEEALVHGSNILVSSGPWLNNEMLMKKLVDRIILDRVSEAVGEGIEPFLKEVYKTFASNIEINEKS